MRRKMLSAVAIFVSIAMLLPVISKAMIETQDNFQGARNNKGSLSDSLIKINLPKRGYLHVFGRPIMPYGKTVIVGSTVIIQGYARNINLLECQIINLKTGEIVYKNSKDRFGSGSFSFTWLNARKGNYKITVWEGYGFAPSAHDEISIIVL